MTSLLICIDRSDFPAEIPHDFYLPHEAPAVLAGPIDLLKRPRFTILNSRQSPRITKASGWVRNSLEVLHRLDPKEAVLVSSLGTTAWDFLTWAGARLGFPVILVFRGGSALNFKVVRTKAIMNLGLDDAKTLAIRPLLLKKYKNKLEKNALRDHWVFALSQRYIPVSVRKGGNLDKRLQHPSLAEDAIDQKHAIQYKPAESNPRIIIPETAFQPDDFDPSQYLIHWTRSCHGPWPDENSADYFGRTINQAEDQSGFATLQRIIKEKRIHASHHLIRGGYQVVPFTARPPEALAELVKWRSGLRRWTFEPYGLAVNKQKLEEMGARPVIYGDLAKCEALAVGDKPFFQLEGSGKHDWCEEQEWRHLGDLNLGKFKRSEIAVITYHKAEAALVQQDKKVKIIHYKND